MPQVYLEGKLKLKADNGFTNKETGEKVEYQTAYIQCETDEGSKVLVINTKLEGLEKHVDRQAIFTLGLRSVPESASFKLTLLKIVPVEEVIE